MTLTDKQHLENILAIIEIDDWDEEVMGHLLDYVDYHKLVDRDFGGSEKRVERLEKRIKILEKVTERGLRG